jgi:cellobiose-specific phosphotransferase system component IIA
MATGFKSTVSRMEKESELHSSLESAKQRLYEAHTQATKLRKQKKADRVWKVITLIGVLQRDEVDKFDRMVTEEV